MNLHEQVAPKGANKRRKRVARGESSGHGKTAGRGGKGQTARTGKGKPGWGFEGGQMPMYRRMPKRGFTNIFAEPTAAVNLDTLASMFAAGSHIDLQVLKARGLCHRRDTRLRILGRGEIETALVIHAHHFSQSARAKLEACGGQIVEL